METITSSPSLAEELQQDKSLDSVGTEEQVDNMVGLGLATNLLVTYSVCYLSSSPTIFLFWSHRCSISLGYCWFLCSGQRGCKLDRSWCSQWLQILHIKQLTESRNRFHLDSVSRTTPRITGRSSDIISSIWMRMHLITQSTRFSS